MRSIEQRYKDAEKLLEWNLQPKLKNLSVEPHWLDQQCFWFKRESCNGYEFILVDSERLIQNPVFDHSRLATGIGELFSVSFDALRLPIEDINFVGEKYLRIIIRPTKTSRVAVLFDRGSYQCTREMTDENIMSVVSPDGQQEVICRENNLLLRDRNAGVETALTDDGEPNFGYGLFNDFISISLSEKAPLLPAAQWSPDGRFLAVQRIDQRQVKTLPVMQSVPEDGSSRPVVESVKMAFPGDVDIPLASLCVIDLESKTIINCNRHPVPASYGGFMDCGALIWGGNYRVYYTEWTRDMETTRLIEFDPKRCVSRILVEEKAPGYIHPAPQPFQPAVIKVLAEIDEFIWYSQRSGWGQLYRYNLSTGQLINPLTSGDFVVTAIHYVDTDKSCLYFTACGREPGCNPYYEHLYRVTLDGGELVLLTPETSQHDIITPGFVTADFRLAADVHGVSPNGKVFVETRSRIDQPPKSLLRSTDDGAELMLLSQCEQSQLSNTPYKSPDSFTVKATDNTTDLWGVIHKPGDFDESQSYPVILALYGTPQVCIVPKRFAEFFQYAGKIARTLAELGFIVVTLDPRGTPLRSKAFQEAVFGDMQNGGGIEDQIYALKQLAERYPWMDINRVGITGHSGGGFASARAMLSHPEFFKVAVSSAGDHDLRLYVAAWGEGFQGLLKGDNYEEQACASLAKNLAGKLLLVHGDMDDNVHVAHTMQLANKLIEHNRDFDLLILPNRRHSYMQDTYFIRRVWDYFVENLLLETPPKNYYISPPESEQKPD